MAQINALFSHDGIFSLSETFEKKYDEIVVLGFYDEVKGEIVQDLWGVFSRYDDAYLNFYFGFDDLNIEDGDVNSGFLTAFAITLNDGPQNDDDDEEPDLLYGTGFDFDFGAFYQKYNGDFSSSTDYELTQEMLDNDDQINGSSYDDTLYGFAGNDTLKGNEGNDFLQDGFGADEVYGGRGDDTINNVGGSDIFIGGDGIDTLITDISSGFEEQSFEIGFDAVQGKHGRLNSSVGQDTISGIENFTLIGNFNAVVSGGDEDNIFITDNGNDILRGGGGDDTLSAWMGDDEVYAGLGNDIIINTGGEDLFDGGEGIDTLITDLSMSVKDKLGYSNWEFTIIFDLTSEDAHMRHYAIKPDGTDYAWDEIYGIENYTLIGDFDAELTGDGQSNILVSDTGADILRGGGGDDTLNGGAGNDTLYGGAGNDTIDGGEGIDTAFIGSEGNLVNFADASVVFDGDVLTISTPNHGTGTFSNVENFVFQDATYTRAELSAIYNVGERYVTDTSDDVVTGSNGNDTIASRAGDDNVSAGAGDDRIAASDGNDTVDGGSGDDMIGGGLGDDSILGGTGHDTIGSGEGNDIVDGGDGNDMVAAGRGDDIVSGGLGDDRLAGSVGEDSIHGDEGEDNIGGGYNNDTIRGGTGNDTVGAGQQDDILYGDEGDDVLNGNWGHDTIFGGDGNDTIAGGDHNDVMTGGNGADVFKFRVFNADTEDRITDFTRGEDLLEMRGSFAGLNISNHADGLQVEKNGHVIILEDVADLSADDFNFV